MNIKEMQQVFITEKSLESSSADAVIVDEEETGRSITATDMDGNIISDQSEEILRFIADNEREG